MTKQRAKRGTSSRAQIKRIKEDIRREGHEEANIQKLSKSYFRTNEGMREVLNRFYADQSPASGNIDYWGPRLDRDFLSGFNNKELRRLTKKTERTKFNDSGTFHKGRAVSGYKMARSVQSAKRQTEHISEDIKNELRGGTFGLSVKQFNRDIQPILDELPGQKRKTEFLYALKGHKGQGFITSPIFVQMIKDISQGDTATVTENFQNMLAMDNRESPRALNDRDFNDYRARETEILQNAIEKAAFKRKTRR